MKSLLSHQMKPVWNTPQLGTHDWPLLKARWLSSKESACQCRRFRRLGFGPWVKKIPQRRKWQAAMVFLPENSHREAWWAIVHEVTESDTTDRLSMPESHLTGESSETFCT